MKNVVVLATLMLAAGIYSAANGENKSKDDRDVTDDYRVGSEVDRICFSRNIDGFRPAGKYDDAVLVERGVNDWHLLTLSGACRYRDFRSAYAIGIDERPRGGCVRRGDIVIVESVGNFINRCFINEIYEWNDNAEPPADDEKESDENET